MTLLLSRYGIAAVAVAAGLAFPHASARAQAKTTFVDHVLPLVEQHCAKCHNPDKKKGDLDLSSHAGVLKGGASGSVVTAGNPDSSKLVKVLTHAEEPFMPPNKPPMAEKELAVFKSWIAGGLLETGGSKAIGSAKPAVDLSLKVTNVGRPEGPPPMPGPLSIESFIHTPRGPAISGLASSPWAPLVAIAGQKQVLLYNSTNLQLLGILPFTEGQPVEVNFSRSGKLLLAGGGHGARSGRVVLWNVETGEPLATVGKEFDAVLAADLSPDQARVALGGPDRLVKVYASGNGELLHKLKKHTDWVTVVAFSPDGAMLATADRNGGLTVWDAENGQELFTTAGHKGAVTSLSWRTDSRLIASSSEDGTVKLWETTEGKQARTWNAHAGGVLSVAYSRDGRFLTCGRDGAVVAWSAEAAKTRTFDFSGEMALRCAWSADDSRVVAGDFVGRVAVWDAKTGQRLGELDPNPRPLKDRLAAARQRVAELEAQGDKPSPEAVAARDALAAVEKEHAAVTVTAAKVEADFAAKAGEVVRLKELAAQTPPPAGIDAQLAAARAAREQVRAARTEATNQVAVIGRKLGEAKANLARLGQPVDRAAELAEARAQLERLQAAARMPRPAAMATPGAGRPR